ncbi:hypothetical protein [Saccharothrix sp. NRRL B-16314]|uniref:hypothetical protein n=1 Tax=Saccharothrix sp. NRRL B-16314 TaxID=1463825 RepID=UPI0012DD120E|nr:hypothetical protein [Saccharothrix sp. NRRL B-16314]
MVRTVLKRVLTMLTVTTAVVMLSVSPASAAYDDSFEVWTLDGCGSVEFVDYGEGAPGGGGNDDYAIVHDYCSDGHGVLAYAWVDIYALGTKYNGNGLAGAPVIWDPYAVRSNVFAGETIRLRVCLVDGASDPTPFRCDEDESVSVDG